MKFYSKMVAGFSGNSIRVFTQWDRVSKNREGRVLGFDKIILFSKIVQIIFDLIIFFPNKNWTKFATPVSMSISPAWRKKVSFIMHGWSWLVVYASRPWVTLARKSFKIHCHYVVIPKPTWPLQANRIRTDGLVGLIGPNRVLLAVALRLMSFGKVCHIGPSSFYVYNAFPLIFMQISNK